MSTADDEMTESIVLHRIGVDPRSAAAQMARDVVQAQAAVVADLRQLPLGAVEQCAGRSCKTTRIRSVRDGELQWVYVYPLHSQSSDSAPTASRCYHLSDGAHRWVRIQPRTTF